MNSSAEHTPGAGAAAGQGGKPLLEASMAAAALVATADGDVSFAERAMLDQAIDALAERAGVETHDGVAAFEDFVDAIRANSSHGRQPALSALAAFARRAAREEAAILLKISDAVAAADGETSPAEAAALMEVRAILAGGDAA